MNPAPLCHCEECQRGDALPMRRQGIPGARQMLLVPLPNPCRIPPAQPELTPQREWDSLPLFAGGLQPTLF